MLTRDWGSRIPEATVTSADRFNLKCHHDGIDLHGDGLRLPSGRLERVLFVIASITWPVPQQRIHHHDRRRPAVDRPMGKPGWSQST